MSDPSFNQLLIDFPTQINDNFSNFIESDSSTLALQAARKICLDTPCPFNALFIAGESGLGKTHLLHAIGNYVAGHRTGERALYMDSERFIKSLNEDDQIENALNEILSADFFLLDDVHKISGNQNAQEKLHHVYNILNQNKKKIVFTANKPPKKLSGLADFLKSRFYWGMVVVLRGIDDITTELLLQKLAGDIELDLPKPILKFLLNRIPRDFRSLLKTVNIINQASYTKKQKVTIQLVKTALDLN